MRIQHHIRNAGWFLVVCLCLIALAAAPAAAEYINEAVTDENDPAYWLDQGGLFATYGNFPAAIEAYKKALALDEDNSAAYFNLGLAYGAMDAYDQALAAINKAIALDAENDRFFYGRGWILLRAGNRNAAAIDFEKAAEMGNRDAINFLRS